MKKYTLSIVLVIVGAILYLYGYYTEHVINVPIEPVSHNFSWGRPDSESYPSIKSTTLKNFGILFLSVGAAIALYKTFKK